MTLEQLYNETSMYIGEVLQKEGNNYIGESITLTNIFNSALNYAYKKICREKYNLYHAENVTSGQELSKKLYKVNSVTFDSEPIDYTINGNSVEFEGENADINYIYIPGDLVEETDEPLLPIEAVDHRILCYYASFSYFNIEDDDRAVKWLNMWEDGFNSISNNRAKQTRVKRSGW